MYDVKRMNTDSENLHEYCSSGSEPAFRRIVANHAPMVHGVATRLTRNHALAEEVTQSVFIILARKAKSVVASRLPGWLHNTATGESRNAMRKESRRNILNQQYTQSMKDMEPSVDPWQTIAPLLDEAVAKLSAEDRQMMLLRYFEQRDFRDISRATGCSVEACKKRAQRALDRLGALLAKRGVSAGGPVIAAAIAGFALVPPTATAATIAGFSIATAGASAGLPAVFKFLKIMTFKHAATRLSAAKLLGILTPALVLTAGAIWTVQQHREVTQIQNETQRVRASVEAGRQKEGAAQAGPPQIQKAKPADGTIDWKKFLKHSRDLIAMMAMDKQLRSLSAAQLLAQLDAVSAMHLTADEKALLDKVLLDSLARKDPKAVMERFADKVNDPYILNSLAAAFDFWAVADPAAAARWLDQQIAAGTFEGNNLDGKGSLRFMYEGPLIYNLLTQDAAAAKARMANLSESQRGDMARGMVTHLDAAIQPAAAKAMAELIQGALPAEERADILGKFAFRVSCQSLDSAANFARGAGDSAAARGQVVAETFKGILTYSQAATYPAKLDAARAWADQEFPGTANRATGAALGSEGFRGGFNQSSQLAVNYQAQSGSDEVLVAYLNSAHVDPRKGLTLVDKIADPVQREETRQALEASAAAKSR